MRGIIKAGTCFVYLLLISVLAKRGCLAKTCDTSRRFLSTKMIEPARRAPMCSRRERCWRPLFAWQQPRAHRARSRIDRLQRSSVRARHRARQWASRMPWLPNRRFQRLPLLKDVRKRPPICRVGASFPSEPKEG